MYQVEIYPLGIYQANCYLLWKDNHVLLIDPGGKSKQLMEYLNERKAVVDAILLTHGHFDHIGGATYFKDAFHCDIYIEEEDHGLLKDASSNGSLNKAITINETVNYYCLGRNEVGSFQFEAIYAPGHTEGSVMLLFDNLLFSGDVLFYHSIGRTDLATGSNSKMQNTLNMIKQMNPDNIVYPGHGQVTTILEELQHNPFLK